MKKSNFLVRKLLKATHLALKSPGELPKAIARNLSKPKKPENHLSQLGNPKGNQSSKVISHVAFFTSSNAGDTLLPVTLRDLLMHFTGKKKWDSQHAHKVVDERAVAVMNRSSGIVIGGGGLFLRDTNPNQNSGWQWNCPIQQLRNIRVPIAVFAVGYNRFRGQDDFDPIFRDHLNLLAEKALYIGLRNYGSIRAINQYLEPSLRSKVRYQPCMTTLCSKIYPDRVTGIASPTPIVALNAAFDRPQLRFGENQDRLLDNIARSMKKLSSRAQIEYFANDKRDETMLPHLEKAGVPYKLVKLYQTPPADVVKAYSRPSLIIGMRGHAQLIPFGCLRPMISLVSHDKVRWFLEDIKAEDWGIEVTDPDLEAKLTLLANSMLDRPEDSIKRLRAAQDELWKISSANVRELAQGFGLSTVL